MFDKVLIANRSAIACRVIRTCRRLGVQTVAIYSPAEGSPLHSELADEAVQLTEMASAVAGYLDIEAVIAAAVDTGAEAIHPGYGFLSENPDFARACENAGIVFVGPSAEAIRLAGNKREARRRLAGYGVPVLPGTEIDLDADVALAAQAESIGYPLMVKASEGGGGIGMNLVGGPKQLERAVRRTRSSSRRAFGSQDVYLERYVPDARHVEVQIVADTDGTVTHLWERECSAQRRHQKVIEEAGSPSITDATRERLISASTLATREIGYTNVCTFEFIVDSDDSPYFIEANARIQVEHGTTEMVTGVDIVEQQLRIASGDGVSVGDVIPAKERHPVLRYGAGTVNGHAIQCRIYAEDPETFIPSPGTLDAFQLPRLDSLRVETGFRQGDEVSSHFDPLLAKLIAWGPTRTDAISLIVGALSQTRVEGVKSNVPALQKALRHPDFRLGRYSTGLMAELG